MTKFIYAKKLKKEFTVLGSYYNIIINSNNTIKCRNLLEIYNKKNYSKLNDKQEQCKYPPEAVAVMMNPGSSKPKSISDDYPPSYKLTKIADKIFDNKMVPAMPDFTQYQIMRIMKYKSWSHVRVINLSDFRQPNCNDFFKEVDDFEKQHESTIHSIFSEEREEERNRIFSVKDNIPIIVAWGCHKSLETLAKRAMRYIDNSSIIGIPYNNNNLFRHPLPSLQKAKVEWLNNITEKLDKK
jgi:hypothetical protein